MRHSALNPDVVHAAKYLCPGKVLPEHFEQLMLLSKIRGKEIFFIYGISPGDFSH